VKVEVDCPAFPKFCTVEKLLRSLLLVEKFLSKNAQFETKEPHFRKI